MSRELALHSAIYGLMIILGICAGNYIFKHVFSKETEVSPYSIDTLYFQQVEDIVVKMPSGNVFKLVSDGINTYIRLDDFSYIPFQFDTSQIKISAIYDSTKTQ